MNYHKVLIVAGSDSGGGAGIQADIKAVSACGAYAATAITAITVQNTLGVSGIHPIPSETIEAQMRAVLSDIGADAIKIGMLHSSEVIRTVAKVINDYPEIPVVLDPVMVSTSGHRLMEEEAVNTLKEQLIPKASIITPNIPEAEVLWDREIKGAEDMENALSFLSQSNQCSVYLKAGHLDENELTDLFYDATDGSLTRMNAKRIETQNTHGTGCTLSSALAAFLAKGLPMKEAARLARSYVYEAIGKGAAYQLGKGHGPVHHFYAFWD